MSEPDRAMTSDEAKALADKPPLSLDQAFDLYKKAVWHALAVSDRYTEAVEHRDVKLSEIIRNRDMTHASSRRWEAERELNRSIVAEFRHAHPR